MVRRSARFPFCFFTLNRRSITHETSNTEQQPHPDPLGEYLEQFQKHFRHFDALAARDLLTKSIAIDPK